MKPNASSEVFRVEERLNPIYRCIKILSLIFLALLFMLNAEKVHAGAEGGNSFEIRKRNANPDILKGIELLYNTDFDEAEKLFRKVVEDFPKRPAGYFYLAMTTWSRLTYGFWSRETVQEFKKRIDRTITVAEKRIGENSSDSYDHFYLGGALGFKGRFELMRNNWLSSFLLARKAIDALEICLETDPSNKDVLFGLGTFDYYTAKMSGVLKFLTYLLIRQGDAEEGLQKLHVAAEEAIYSSSEAKSMLLHIYLFLEEDFLKALRVAEDLEQRYHSNSRYTVLKGVCYIRLGMDEKYRDTVTELRKKNSHNPSTKTANEWARRALYLEIIDDLFHELYPQARAKAEMLLKQSDEENDPGMIGWPMMKIGTSYDLEGYRQKAVESYEKVLNLKNAAGAQFLAQKYLSDPPHKTDPFIGY